MAEGGEDFEMDDLGRKEEEEEEEEDTDETDLTDEDQKAVTIGRTSAGDGITHVADGDIPNVRLDAGAMKRSDIAGKKRSFFEAFGVKVNVGDGEESKDLIKRTKFDFGKDKKVIGVWYDNKKVYVRRKDGKIRPSRNRTNKKALRDLWEHIRKAEVEHSKTLAGAIEKANNDPTTSQEVVDDITSQVISESESMIEGSVEDLREQAREILTEQEAREFIGMLEPQGTSAEKIELLETEADYYREKAIDEEDPRKRQLYEKFSEVAEMKADTIRIRIGDAPQHIDVMSVLEDEVRNNDLNRLERFKKWAMENMVGLSAIAITIAGIVTTIVVAARRTVSGGARAVGGFAKALANLGKSLGPLLAPLFSVIAQVLTWGAKGIAWLANNLWVLAIAMTWLLYDYWKNSKNRK